MPEARITEIVFQLRDNETLCRVDINANGCPGVVGGQRVKRFPAITKLGKLKGIIESFEKDHPKDWQ
jgi:hypothetical protein